jgi:hypothetical protein
MHHPTRRVDSRATLFVSASAAFACVIARGTMRYPADPRLRQQRWRESGSLRRVEIFTDLSLGRLK